VGGVTDFLLELRSEEIPARMQQLARYNLAEDFSDALYERGLSVGNHRIETYSTPRRLVLIARGLAPQTQATSEERKGPRANAPEQALAGFLRSTGLAREQLVERDGVLFAVIERPGRPTADVLAEAIPAIVRGFAWPKSMRWGAASTSTASLRWVRPLQGIVALFGDAVVPCEVDGIVSGAATVGHRFLSPRAITIGSAGDYVEKLRLCHVIVDQAEREGLIRDRARVLAAEAGYELVEDEALVVENAGLTEWPVPLLGSFDAAFLDVPEEVVALTARINQKYFVMRDAAGRLAPRFIATANVAASDGGAAVVAGNEKVLAARLSDARFFWEGDLKVALEVQAAKLKDIVFHEKLGTVADKVDRVAKLARWLVETGVVGRTSPLAVRGGANRIDSPHPNPSPEGEGLLSLADKAERAARLCKADLVTGMVGEFPELQGVIGGYLAWAQGENAQVADAIRDHYQPVGQGDAVPTAAVTVAVSLADKLDSLCQFFRIGEQPTGSRDPFALRRAALGLVATINRNQLRLPIHRAIEQAFADTIIDYGAGRALMDFLVDRLKVQQRDQGTRADIVDAVFSQTTEDDLARLLARVKALQEFLTTLDGTNLLAGYKRAANILKKEGPPPTPRRPGLDPGSRLPGDAAASSGTPDQVRGDGGAGVVREEEALARVLGEVEPRVDAAIAAEDFAGAMIALASLRVPIDAFFDAVMVNDPDPAIRARRLALLVRFRDAVQRVADFSRIDG